MKVSVKFSKRNKLDQEGLSWAEAQGKPGVYRGAKDLSSSRIIVTKSAALYVGTDGQLYHPRDYPDYFNTTQFLPVDETVIITIG